MLLIWKLSPGIPELKIRASLRGRVCQALMVDAGGISRNSDDNLSQISSRSSTFSAFIPLQKGVANSRTERPAAGAWATLLKRSSDRFDQRRCRWRRSSAPFTLAADDCRLAVCRGTNLLLRGPPVPAL